MRKKCSSDRVRSLEQFIQTVKGQNSNWKKLLGFRNMQEKLEIFFFCFLKKLHDSIIEKIPSIEPT